MMYRKAMFVYLSTNRSGLLGSKGFNLSAKISFIPSILTEKIIIIKIRINNYFDFLWEIFCLVGF